MTNRLSPPNHLNYELADIKSNLIVIALGAIHLYKVIAYIIIDFPNPSSCTLGNSCIANIYFYHKFLIILGHTLACDISHGGNHTHAIVERREVDQ